MKPVILPFALIVLAFSLMACGGASFTAADPTGETDAAGDGGAALETPDAGSAPDAKPDVIAQVTPSSDAGPTPDATDAGPTADSAPAHDAAPVYADAAGCVTDLSHVGLGGYSISFTLTTTEHTLPLALVSQRGDCKCQSASQCASPSYFWDIVLVPSGVVTAITDGNTASTYVAVSAPSRPVNDGQPHKITVTHSAAGYLDIYIDSSTASLGSVTDNGALEALAPLTVGSDACESTSPATTPLSGHGMLSNLCLTIQ
jgi:hypothetical protein